MFAYCGNNPTNNYDPTGHAFWGINTVAICDGGTSGLVYNQNQEPHGQIKLESATVSHGGCGPVAVQNAMQLLGNYSTSLEEVIEYYRNNDGFIFGGWLGSRFDPANKFLEEQGYQTILLNNSEISAYSGIEASFDAGIILYAFDSTEFPYLGVHYVAFRQCGHKGYYFNLYSDSKGPYEYDGYVVDLLSKEGYYPLGMLLISGG